MLAHSATGRLGRPRRKIHGAMLRGGRVLITGGAGFIGSRLASRLAADNDVVLFDDLTRNALQRTGVLSLSRVELVKGDVIDAGALDAVLSGATHVVHMAAVAGVGTVLGSPIRTLRVNLLGTMNILEAASRLRGLARIVTLSTSEIFGPQASDVDEVAASRQGCVEESRWSYAVSKLAGEHLANAYHRERGLPAVRVRPFNVYGPGQVGQGAVHEFVVRAIRGEELVIHGDGSQVRAWCYVDDVVEALVRVLVLPAATGQAFNIGNPRTAVTVLELARLVVAMSGSSSRIVHRPLDHVDVEVRVPRVTKAREVLGWEPTVDLDEGLVRTIDWYRAFLA